MGSLGVCIGVIISFYVLCGCGCWCQEKWIIFLVFILRKFLFWEIQNWFLLDIPSLFCISLIIFFKSNSQAHTFSAFNSHLEPPHLHPTVNNFYVSTVAIATPYTEYRWRGFPAQFSEAINGDDKASLTMIGWQIASGAGRYLLTSAT